MNLTYRQLFDLIGKMSEEELDRSVTIRTPIRKGDEYEYYAVINIKYAENDVLDKGHPYLEGVE